MRGWRNLFRRTTDGDLDREVTFHIEEVTRANIDK